VQAPGRSWLLRLSSRRAEVLLRAALCCAEGLRALLPRCRGLCIGRPVCPGASGTAARMCAAEANAAECARLVAGLCGDGGTALAPAAVADQETARLLPATQRPLL
ncbi:Mismatch DNA repair ATPase, partial [Giardia duodenalis]